MRASITFTICTLVSLAVAQDLSKLPQCARNCVGTSLGSTGCNPLDVTCICKSSSWISGVSCCLVANCPKPDQDATIQFADSFCATVGVTLPTAAVCSTGVGSTSAAPASTGGTSSSTSLSQASASGTTSAGTNTASTTSGSATGTPVTAAASAASAAATTPATGAANTHGSELGLLSLAAALFAMV